ncbi:hypothetical protein [Paraferrimonas sedimenticola]|uniref:Uncharacterized protein n=1 Tax=Paraferrimonas sedimenticola TaxID=375674 RepID=A0AA37RT69_9GAMM|nr:hypothetical protein [Paraferrimonas sedimenticola]GLP95176.1 hypothetical protein GCM10007895_04820 [Paraferrimonas sedimenticola]
MKNHPWLVGLILSLLLLAQPASSESHEHHSQRMGMHGMLLFSDGQQLLASHLPMFHKPHDMQLVLRLSLQNSTLQQALITEIAADAGIWTLAPEVFDLTALGQGDSFHGDLYQGHFERGGKKRHTQQQVTVERVILRNVLSEESVEAGEFRLLNHGPVSYYALFIQGRPGTDRVLKVQHQGQLPKHFRAAIDSTDAQLAELLGLSDGQLTTHYLETGDLQ